MLKNLQFKFPSWIVINFLKQVDVFIPSLIFFKIGMQTSEVGSYNLGHKHVFLYIFLKKTFENDFEFDGNENEFENLKMNEFYININSF